MESVRLSPALSREHALTHALPVVVDMLEHGDGPYVAFWVRFTQVPVVPTPRPGLVRIEVNACTRLEPACLRFNRSSSGRIAPICRR